MNRIEKVREIVDGILVNMSDEEERRCAYVHLYGVSQACALLALKRNENVELATIAGMLHDISSYVNMDSDDHAHRGAELSRSMLHSLELFEENEIEVICMAIYHHSDKAVFHNPLDEILKDADVMQHVLYNPLFAVKEQEKVRFAALQAEFAFLNSEEGK